MTDRPTDRPTDRATQSVITGHIYVCSTAMRPNNKQWHFASTSENTVKYYIYVICILYIITAIRINYQELQTPRVSCCRLCTLPGRGRGGSVVRTSHGLAPDREARDVDD